MGRPALPDEVKIRRGTYRPGRAHQPVSGLCDSASRRLQMAKDLLDPDALEIYSQAIHHVELRTPHADGKHMMPSIDSLGEIEIVEGAVDLLLTSIGADAHLRSVLSLHSSDLFRLIIDQEARSILTQQTLPLEHLRNAVSRNTGPLRSRRQPTSRRYPVGTVSASAGLVHFGAIIQGIPDD